MITNIFLPYYTSILTSAWFQASAAKWLRAAFFRVVTQRLVITSHQRFETIGPETSVRNYYHSLLIWQLHILGFPSIVAETWNKRWRTWVEIGRSHVLISTQHRLQLSEVFLSVSSTFRKILGSSPNSTGHEVAQWLRYCATNLKVAGSIPNGVIRIFNW
jgi:hypothetical protein